jgi:hypothetical protein
LFSFDGSYDEHKSGIKASAETRGNKDDRFCGRDRHRGHRTDDITSSFTPRRKGAKRRNPKIAEKEHERKQLRLFFAPLRLGVKPFFISNL